MKRPCFAFDGRCMLDAPALRQIGFQVRAIGSTAPKAAPAPREAENPAWIKQALNAPGPLDY
jgi:hypothetical protein